MLVTLINALSVILGATIGTVLKNRISENFKTIVMTSAGIVTLVLALNMVLSYEASAIGVLFALIIGGFIGYALKLEDRILSIGNKKRKAESANDGETIAVNNNRSFGMGFLNSSILFCSGAMSIVGSIQAGTTGDGNLILIKSVMDGFMAIVFASAYGRGVFLSALVVLVYQGFFVLTSSFIEPSIGEGGINAIAASGGYLLIMIGLGLLEIKKIKTANFLPALILSPVFCYLFSLIGA